MDSIDTFNKLNKSEFLSTFDLGSQIADCVTRSEFINYYTCVSAVIESDVVFEKLLTSIWSPIPQQKTHKKKVEFGTCRKTTHLKQVCRGQKML